MIYFLLGYLFAVSLLTFALYGIDKYKAQHNKWRISEATLLLMAVIGGSVGALLAMKAFRHKTQHLKFTLGVPLILIIQIILGVWLYMR